ncbi:MAG TPA: asparagine--tRNA ligase [Phycisphaerales bacterium]|nr:asparagine--tRNA ligase [Phycisphaerales bacterium]
MGATDAAKVADCPLTGTCTLGDPAPPHTCDSTTPTKEFPPQMAHPPPVVSVKAVLNGQGIAPGDRVQVQGWVRTRRDSKAGLSFIQLHDGTCFDAMQVVAAGELDNYATDVQTLTAGSSVICVGQIVESQGKGQSVEMQAESVIAVGLVDDPDTYPVPPKRHTFEYLREQAHLRVRTNTFSAIARVRHCLAQAVHRYFHENGFYWVHTPIVTASDCEGAGEMFRVSTLDLANLPHGDDGGIDFGQDFFGRESFLTVSGQLNVESYCLALSKVYTFGPTFRAENSNTSRHLAEFWMIEPEIAFADLSDDADLAEDFLKYIFRVLLDELPDDMGFFRDRIDKTCIDRLEAFVESSFERMEYTDAITHLEKAIAGGQKFDYPVSWGVDLQSEHERWLTEEHVGRPVVLMNYPKDIKAFYMRLNDDGRTVAAMDVLAPGIGEIIGGAQREERLEVLDARIDEMELERDAYWWYRDLRKYGSVPHAGFGLGFERTIAYATGMANVRDVIPFPRTPRNASF